MFGASRRRGPGRTGLHSPATRKLVSSCIDLFIKGDLPDPAGRQGGPGSAAGVFDGIDLDWEWPGSEGNVGNVIRPEDKQNFTLLLARSSASSSTRTGTTTGRQYLLTAFLPADRRRSTPASRSDDLQGPRLRDRPGLRPARRLGAADQPPGATCSPRRPTRAGPRFSVDGASTPTSSAAHPADKLVVGVPVYGARLDRRAGRQQRPVPDLGRPGARRVGGGRERLRGRRSSARERLHHSLRRARGDGLAVRLGHVLDVRRPCRHAAQRASTSRRMGSAGSCSGSSPATRRTAT